MSLEQTSIEASLGKPAVDRQWEAAIIVQGPYTSNTATSVRVFIERNDITVLVIVSTYLPDAERNGDARIGTFLSDFEKDIVVREQGPHVGRLIYLFVRTPSKEQHPEFWKTNYYNQNSQRLSSFIGLQYAHQLGIEFSLKCRSDSLIGMKNVCRFIINYTTMTPVLRPAGSSVKLRGRITVNDLSTIRRQDCTIFRIDRQLGSHRVADYWQCG